MTVKEFKEWVEANGITDDFELVHKDWEFGLSIISVADLSIMTCVSVDEDSISLSEPKMLNKALIIQ